MYYVIYQKNWSDFSDIKMTVFDSEIDANNFINRVEKIDYIAKIVEPDDELEIYHGYKLNYNLASGKYSIEEIHYEKQPKDSGFPKMEQGYYKYSTFVLYDDTEEGCLNKLHGINELKSFPKCKYSVFAGKFNAILVPEENIIDGIFEYSKDGIIFIINFDEEKVYNKTYDEKLIPFTPLPITGFFEM